MTVRAIVFTPYQSFERRYLMAAQMAGMELHASPDLQDWSTQLFRNDEAIGILWARGGASAAETMRRTRIGNVRNPVIALIQYTDMTPAQRAEAHILALAAGADDAQSMDIDIDELAARLLAISTRVRVAKDTVSFGGCVYNPHVGVVKGPNGRACVSKKMAAVLEALARYPGKVCTKRDLMNALYGGIDEPDSKIIEVFVCRLRAALRDVSGGLDFIETVWGRGYAFNPAGYERETGTSLIIRNRKFAS